MSKYLDKQKTEKFKDFLDKRNIKFVKIAKILDPESKDAAIITYYFKNNRWKTSDYEKVVNELKKEAEKAAINFRDEALEGFEELE